MNNLAIIPPEIRIIVIYIIGLVYCENPSVATACIKNAIKARVLHHPKIKAEKEIVLTST